jgi:AraC family transcriptional regulator
MSHLPDERMSQEILDITKVHLPKRSLAYIRNVGPYMGDAKLFARLFERVMGLLKERNVMRPDMEAITVYHDDPETVPVEKQRISVGFTVPEGTTPEGEIKILGLPESDYVVGTFELLPHEYARAWTDTFAYMGEHGYRPSGGPMYESYKNDPTEHPEGKHIVDICVAVA